MSPAIVVTRQFPLGPVPTEQLIQSSPRPTLNTSTSSQQTQHFQAQYPTALERYNLLAEAVVRSCPSPSTLGPVLMECIDLFFRYIAPLNMSVHEPTVRRILDQVLGTLPSSDPLTDQAFTLLTAVCAKVCCFVPSELFPIGASLAEIFLEASRSCFSTYAEADLENPCAESITVRYLHSNCLHTCARPVLAWHIFGEAVRLAQRMRLHDETSYANLSTVEAESRRHAFWQLYAGDKSLAILRSMPIVIHDYSFEGGITVAYPSDEENQCVCRKRLQHVKTWVNQK